MYNANAHRVSQEFLINHSPSQQSSSGQLFYEHDIDNQQDQQPYGRRYTPISISRSLATAVFEPADNYALADEFAEYYSTDKYGQVEPAHYFPNGSGVYHRPSAPQDLGTDVDVRPRYDKSAPHGTCYVDSQHYPSNNKPDTQETGSMDNYPGDYKQPQSTACCMCDCANNCFCYPVCGCDKLYSTPHTTGEFTLCPLTSASADASCLCAGVELSVPDQVTKRRNMVVNSICLPFTCIVDMVTLVPRMFISVCS